MLNDRSLDILSISWVCQLQGFVVSFCATMETYSLMLLAIERYYYIVKKQPLIKTQIQAMILFGWIWIGDLNFAIQPSLLYCSIPSWKPSVRPFLIPLMIQMIVIIHVIGYCYFKINRETRIWAEFKDKPNENIISLKTQTSDAPPAVATSRNCNSGVCKILVTCVVLGTVSLIAWLPVSICYIYSMITGQKVGSDYEAASILIWSTAMFGDVIILAIVDKRWTAAIQQVVWNK
jgi:hypothetical protein